MEWKPPFLKTFDIIQFVSSGKTSAADMISMTNNRQECLCLTQAWLSFSSWHVWKRSRELNSTSIFYLSVKDSDNPEISLFAVVGKTTNA